MLFSVEQAFVGRDEKRALLKTPAWEASVFIEYNNRLIARWRHFTQYQNPLNPGLHEAFYRLS